MMDISLMFPENKILHFMLSLKDSFYFSKKTKVDRCFLGKIRQIFQYIICWIFIYPALKCDIGIFRREFCYFYINQM